MSCSTAIINSVPLSVIERLSRLHCCFQDSQSQVCQDFYICHFYIYFLQVTQRHLFQVRLKNNMQLFMEQIYPHLLQSTFNQKLVKHRCSLTTLYKNSSPYQIYSGHDRQKTRKKVLLRYPKPGKVKLLRQCPT